MDFIEKGFITTVPPKEVFIYFLLQKGKKVVYIGKTVKGFSRPVLHKDKKFDSVACVFCTEKEIDYLEAFYITKYKPIYNKELPGVNILLGIKAALRMQGKENASIKDAKKYLTHLGIFGETFNGKLFLNKKEYKKLLCSFGIDKL